jgi:hypothetical protein
MRPTLVTRRSGPAVAALAIVALLGACVCFDPTIRFDVTPVAPLASTAPAASATTP